MNKAVVLFVVAGCVFCGACNMIGVIGSKSYYEQKVPAEFMLKDVAEGGVLIFVDEAGGGREELELRPVGFALGRQEELDDLLLDLLRHRLRRDAAPLVDRGVVERREGRLR